MVRDSLHLVGRTLDGEFRLDSIVGEGGFAVVYRGVLLSTGDPVAVKCLKLQAASGTEEADAFARRFRDEGRLLQGLSQGNADIVRCLSMSTTVSPSSGLLLPYMALEWLEGQTLGVDLRARRQHGMKGRSLEEVLRLFEPAALALEWAHRNGVVHRDVKPGNLFLTPAPPTGVRMKVLDFGLAKILDEKMDITLAATAGNILMCSPRYAAPEHFDARLGGYGPWTDVYCFTLVLLEALRDARIRKAEGLLPCMEAALDSKADLRTRTLGIHVPGAVEKVLARAVAFRAKERPGSAGELWTELKTAAGARADAPPPSVMPDSSSTLRGPPRPEPSAPAGPRSLGGTLIMARPSSPGSQPRGPSTSPPASPRDLGSTVPLGSRRLPRVSSALPSVTSTPAVVSSTPEPPVGRRGTGRAITIVLVILMLAGAGAGVFFGWRAWKARGRPHWFARHAPFALEGRLG